MSVASKQSLATAFGCLGSFLLVSGCVAQSYRPKNFDRLCAKVKVENRSVEIPNASAVKFGLSNGGGITQWAYCVSDCMEFMYKTHIPVIADVLADPIHKIPPLSPDRYYDYLKVSGRYIFSISNSPECVDVVAQNNRYFEARKAGSTDVMPIPDEAVRKCIVVSKSSINKRIVYIEKAMSEVYAPAEHGPMDGSFGDIRSLPENFYLDGALTAKLINIYYQVPPGPSSEVCEMDMAGLEINVFTRDIPK